MQLNYFGALKLILAFLPGMRERKGGHIVNVSTMGVQRRYNYALQPMSREAFVELVTADQPEAPAYFAYDAMLNRRERQTLDEALEQELTPLSLDTVLQLMTTGAQVVDVRDVADFAGAHLQSSLNISLSVGAHSRLAR